MSQTHPPIQADEVVVFPWLSRSYSSYTWSRLSTDQLRSPWASPTKLNGLKVGGPAGCCSGRARILLPAIQRLPQPSVHSALGTHPITMKRTRARTERLRPNSDHLVALPSPYESKPDLTFWLIFRTGSTPSSRAFLAQASIFCLRIIEPLRVILSRLFLLR